MDARRIASALLACLCQGVALAAPADLTLVYNANLNGELEPCGCSVEGDLGGLQRRATYLEQLRADGRAVLVLEAGGVITGDLATDRIRNRYILAALRRTGHDAIGLQWQDLVHGSGFLHESALPWTAANLPAAGLPAHLDIERGERRFVYAQWLDPDTSPYRGMASPFTAGTDTAALRATLAAARRTGATTLLATPWDAERSARTFPLDLIDILLLPARGETPGAPARLGTTLALQPGTRGMRMGQLDLQLAPDGRVAGWSHEVVALPPAVAKSPALADWYAAYNAELKQDYQARVARRRQMEQGKTPYVGAAACQTCHAGTHQTWQATRHAHAFATLQRVNKQFDPGCVGCHTVGYEQPGGFLDANLTGHLAGVQCESCHGAGRTHVQSGGQARTPEHVSLPEARCARCHHPKHSPGFDFGTYWPRIAHPTATR